jgi:Tfp pilus assembly protein PilN
MKLRLNLSTAPQENRRPFVAGAVFIGALAIIALLVLSDVAYHSWQSNRTVRAEIAVLQDQISRSSGRQAQLAAYFRSPEAQKVLDRANFLNSLIGQRSFPWTDVFGALEETLPAGVRVLKIEPKLVNGRVELSLTIAAANDEQSTRFLQAMEQSKAFSNVELISHGREDRAESSDHVTLQLKVEYEAI